MQFSFCERIQRNGACPHCREEVDPKDPASFFRIYFGEEGDKELPPWQVIMQAQLKKKEEALKTMVELAKAALLKGDTESADET